MFFFLEISCIPNTPHEIFFMWSFGNTFDVSQVMCNVGHKLLNWSLFICSNANLWLTFLSHWICGLVSTNVDGRDKAHCMWLYVCFIVLYTNHSSRGKCFDTHIFGAQLCQLDCLCIFLWELKIEIFSTFNAHVL